MRVHEDKILLSNKSKNIVFKPNYVLLQHQTQYIRILKYMKYIKHNHF